MSGDNKNVCNLQWERFAHPAGLEPGTTSSVGQAQHSELLGLLRREFKNHATCITFDGYTCRWNW